MSRLVYSTQIFSTIWCSMIKLIIKHNKRNDLRPLFDQVWCVCMREDYSELRGPYSKAFSE